MGSSAQRGLQAPSIPGDPQPCFSSALESQIWKEGVLLVTCFYRVPPLAPAFHCLPCVWPCGFRRIGRDTCLFCSPFSTDRTLSSVFKHLRTAQGPASPYVPGSGADFTTSGLECGSQVSAQSGQFTGHSEPPTFGHRVTSLNTQGSRSKSTKVLGLFLTCSY